MATPSLEPTLFVLSWFGLVPLLYVMDRASTKQAYISGLTTGFTLYLVSCYWAVPFVENMKGFGTLSSVLTTCIFWLYSAQVFAFIAVIWNRISNRVLWQRLLLFPTIVVAIYSLTPNIIPIQISLGQSEFLLALQAIDIVGIYGLDFMIALSNICIYEFIRARNSNHSRLPFVISSIIFSAWFSYGYYGLTSWEERQTNWATKKVGLVQPNDQASITIPIPPKGYGWSYPPEMEKMEALVREGAEIVFWPESRYKGYFDSPYVQASYEHRIKALSTPLVMQDLERTIDAQSAGETKTYNSMILLSEDGVLQSTYRKQKRIAFAEYTPFFEPDESLYQLAKSYFGGFLTNISAGEESKTFSAAGMNIIPLICYEALFSEFVANTVNQQPTGGLFFIASFDAWLGESHAPFQHLAASRIRAVENRRPMVHLINNGPSAVIMPSGRTLAQTSAFEEQSVLIDTPYSNTLALSFYSKYPKLFTCASYLILLLFILSHCIKVRTGTTHHE